MGWVQERVEDVGDFAGDVASGVGDALGDAVDFVEEEVVDPVVDFGETFVKSLGQGVEDLFEGDLDEVLRNPAVRTVASIAFPQYAAYINLGAKAATGEEITATDLAAAGLQGYADLKGVRLPAGTEKAVTASAQIAEGKDPVQALASTYGPDWLEESGLDQQVKTALTNTVGEDYSNRITNTIDLNEAAADYAAGNSTERILAKQFGDEVVSYLGADSPSQRALGFAGIETAVQKAEGASDEDALLAGAETYYNRGGQLPDAGQIASLAGVEDVDFDINKLVGNLDLDFPTLQGQGYDLPSLAGLGIDLPSLEGIETPELLSNFQLPEVANLGFDIPSLDLSGYKPTDLGYDVGEFGQLRDLGVDIGSLDLGDYNLEQLADLNLDLQLPELDKYLQGMGQAPSQLASLDPDAELMGTDRTVFDIPEGDDEEPLSQQLLKARLV